MNTLHKWLMDKGSPFKSVDILRCSADEMRIYQFASWYRRVYTSGYCTTWRIPLCEADLRYLIKRHDPLSRFVLFSDASIVYNSYSALFDTDEASC